MSDEGVNFLQFMVVVVVDGVSCELFYVPASQLFWVVSN
jgi:hypothetical protein